MTCIQRRRWYARMQERLRKLTRGLIGAWCPAALDFDGTDESMVILDHSVNGHHGEIVGARWLTPEEVRLCLTLGRGGWAGRKGKTWTKN